MQTTTATALLASAYAARCAELGVDPDALIVTGLTAGIEPVATQLLIAYVGWDNLDDATATEAHAALFDGPDLHAHIPASVCPALVWCHDPHLLAGAARSRWGRAQPAGFWLAYGHPPVDATVAYRDDLTPGEELVLVERGVTARFDAVESGTTSPRTLVQLADLAARHPDPEVRRWAVRFDPARAHWFVADVAWQVRWECAVWGARPVVEELVGDPHPEVAAAAREHLVELDEDDPQ